MIVGSGFPAVSRFIVRTNGSETINAGGVITADNCGTLKALEPSGSITTNTTNAFTAPTMDYQGCCMDVVNQNAANTITLDANANFKTAGGADVVLTPFDSVRVCSNGIFWFQIGSVSANN
jgi:hypothetical protein